MSAQTKLELMGLVDSAVAAGWAHVRACRVLQIEDVRVHRWRARLRETGSLDEMTAVRAGARCTGCWSGRSRRSSI